MIKIDKKIRQFDIIKTIIWIMIVVAVAAFYFIGNNEGYNQGVRDGEDTCRVTINKELRTMSDKVDQVFSDHTYNLGWDCNGKDAQTTNSRDQVEEMMEKECILVTIW